MIQGNAKVRHQRFAKAAASLKQDSPALVPGFPNISGFRGLSTRRDPWAECPHLPCFWKAYHAEAENQAVYSKRRSHLKPCHKIEHAQAHTRCLGSSEGLLPSDDIGSCLSSVTPHDPINWMLLTTDTYCTTENILKINTPGRNGLATGCNPKAEYPVWGPAHTTAGWSGECMFPAHGSGKAQLEDDTDLRIRGRIWTGYDFYLPQTDKSLVHPSVLQLGDKLGLFTPDRSEQNERCLPTAKQSSDARPQRESHLCLTTTLEGLWMADTRICLSSFTINKILPSWFFFWFFFLSSW